MFNNAPQDDFYRYEDNLDPDAEQRARGRLLKQRLAELEAEQDKFYRPQRVTVTDTTSTPSCSVLEQSGCIHCGATYGHTIKCPTLNREAAEEQRRIDAFFLKSLRISID